MPSVLKQRVTSDVNTGITSFDVFASPETLLLPAWTKLVYGLIKIKILNDLCAEEVHLLINFRLSFRRKFLNLSGSVFNKLIKTYVNNGMQANSDHLITLCFV